MTLMKRQMYKQDATQVVRTQMLSQDEMFLLSYLKSFNRAKAKAWKEQEMWDFVDEE